jgi:hypothetical protein
VEEIRARGAMGDVGERAAEGRARCRGISDGASSAEGDGAGFGAGVDLFAVAETLGLAGRRTSQEIWGGRVGRICEAKRYR